MNFLTNTLSKRMRIIFLITFFFISLILKGQHYNPFREHIDWKKWEINVPDSIKISEFLKLNKDFKERIDSDRKSGREDSADPRLKEISNGCHFVDFNLDGKADIIYSGDALDREGTNTKYWLNRDGSYGLVFDSEGVLINIQSFIPGVPSAINLSIYPWDPPEVEQLIDTYNIVIDKSYLNFRKISTICVIDETVFPDSITFFKPFAVQNDGYKLRLSAKIDAITDYFSRDWYGNEIATYPKGSIGYELSTQTDKTGRVWWFVLMINNLKPIRDYCIDKSDRYYSVGWMSSKFLKDFKTY